MNQLMLKGKNVEVSPALRHYIEGKVRRLSRHLERILETKVELCRENTRSQEDRYSAQVTISTNHTVLRAEERGEELRVAIDVVMDVIDRQIARYKGKLYGRGKGSAGRAESGPEAEVLELGEVETTKVVKRKRFPIKPMFPEEAAEQMELLGHDFFAFFNGATNQICVIYRRRAGDYGLLEPEPD